ncbi:PKD domain-containing protein [Agromyces soli]
MDQISSGDAPATGPDDSSTNSDDAEPVLGEGDADATAPPPPPANCSPTNTSICAGTPGAPPAVEPAGEPVLTMRDIESFRPAVATFAMQPDGWAVVGLPTNFVAEAPTQTVPGEVLARPVEVRFTPVAYRWVFSDGVELRARSAGASWEQLGVREFTDTDTSRRFEASGRVSAALVVTYTAEYRFAGSVWRSIAGTLDRSGQTREILVGELDTVLTDGDCVQNPRGPGC